MKLTASLTLNNQSSQCQFDIEVNLDDDAEMDEIQEKTNKATAALKIAVNSVINIKALNNVPAAKAPKQLPSDQASPGQIKYLKDLTGKCGTTLKKWCQSKGVSENNITGGHCQEWIPELQKSTFEPVTICNQLTAHNNSKPTLPAKQRRFATSTR